MDVQQLSERQCFTEHEPIHQQENHTYEYKHFAKYSANAQINEHTLLKTICGMINCLGGYIFIGIKETQEGGDIQREVVGYTFTERDKEEYKMYINTLTKRFYPKVDPSELDIQVKFIPVLCNLTKKYVIKIIVNRGFQNYFYSFKYRLGGQEVEVNQFYKRYDCETRQIVEMSEIYNEILERNKKAPTKGVPPILRASNFRLEQGMYQVLKEQQQERQQQEKLARPKSDLNRTEEMEVSQLSDVMPQDSTEQFECSIVKDNEKQTMSPTNPSPILGSNTEPTPAEISMDSSESVGKSMKSEPVKVPQLKHSSSNPYHKTIVKGIGPESMEEFEKGLKQFKRNRTKKSMVKGTPEYVLEFSSLEEHEKFVEYFRQRKSVQMVYQTE